MPCFQAHAPDYPDLEGDEVRRNIWLVDVPLAATHHLRNSINNGKAAPSAVLERYEVPIVASALKLYLLELPGKNFESKSLLRTSLMHHKTHWSLVKSTK